MKSPQPREHKYAEGGRLSLSAESAGLLIEAVTKKGGNIRFQAKGGSMYPFIKDGDIVTVAPVAGGELRLGDVVAVAPKDGCGVVLHRIVKQNIGIVTIKGDNVWRVDGKFHPETIHGRLVGIERNGYRINWGLGPERKILAYLSFCGVWTRLIIPVIRLLRRAFLRGDVSL